MASYNKKINEDKKAKFIMSGLTIIMMTTLVIYYIGSIIANKYIVSFSVDSIVGVIAFGLLLRNLSIKYKLLSSVDDKKDFILLDALSITLCILIKIAFRIPFDMSLPILIIAYYISKKKFEKIFN